MERSLKIAKEIMTRCIPLSARMWVIPSLLKSISVAGSISENSPIIKAEMKPPVSSSVLSIIISHTLKRISLKAAVKMKCPGDMIS